MFLCVVNANHHYPNNESSPQAHETAQILIALLFVSIAYVAKSKQSPYITFFIM